jgi:hypothetical protein
MEAIKAMKKAAILLLSLAALPSSGFAQLQLNQPATPQAQPAPRPRPPAPATPAPAPKVEVPPPASDEVVITPPKVKITNPQAVFTGLDKITGRIITFDVSINETVQFGSLQITPRVCYTRPPTEAPQTTSFVDVNEKTLQGDLRKVFTGWMFAASPGLSGVEHAVYDVWLADCKGATPPVAVRPTPAPTPAATPTRGNRNQPAQPRTPEPPPTD